MANIFEHHYNILRNHIGRSDNDDLSKALDIVDSYIDFLEVRLHDAGYFPRKLALEIFEKSLEEENE